MRARASASAGCRLPMTRARCARARFRCARRRCHAASDTDFARGSGVTTRSAEGGVAGGRAAQSGSRVRIGPGAPPRLPNAGEPHNISKTIAPNAQTSAWRSTGRPRSCSGDRYEAASADPRVGSRPSTSESPASSSFTRPRSDSWTSRGRRRRCTNPWAWADSRPSAICRAISSASATGIGPAASRSASDGPSTSSVASAQTPSVSSSRVERRQVRVVERDEGRSHLPQPDPRGRVARQPLRQHAQRDGSRVPGVAGAVPVAIVVRGDPREDFVGADARAFGEHHFRTE